MLAAVCALALLRLAAAKGPADYATLRGPGIEGAAEIVDPADLAALGFGAVEEFEYNGRAGLAPPADPGPGFVLTRYLLQRDGRRIAWDALHFYPQPGGRDIIFFDGLIGDSSTEFDGRWYPATEGGAAAMRRILARLGALPPAAQALPAAGEHRSYHAPLLLAAILTLAGLQLHRRLPRR